MVTSDKAAFNIQWKKVNQRTPTSMSLCPLRDWSKSIGGYMRIGYVLDLRFSERKIQPISMSFGILNKE